jgi:hypothetical protein
MVNCPIIDPNKFQPLKNDLIRSITIFNYQNYRELENSKNPQKFLMAGQDEKKQVKSFR